MEVTTQRAARATRTRLRLVNAFTGWILRTAWLRRLADRQVIELRYTSSTGRAVSLPVMYAQRGEVLVVLVGGPEGKHWWRHFRRPQPVQVLLRGVHRSGVARVVALADADRSGAEEIYAGRFPDIPADGDPMVVINLDPAQPAD